MNNNPKKVRKQTTPGGSQSNKNSLKSDDNNTKSLAIRRKSEQKSLGKQRKQAPIFQFNHIKKVIKETPKEGYYTCSLCLGSEFTFKCIRKHALSKKHRENSKGDDDYSDFRSKCEKNFNYEDLWESDSEDEAVTESQPRQEDQDKRKEKIMNDKTSEVKETKNEKEGFLSFLHTCCALGLSICQISLLSKELKRLEMQSKLDFLSKIILVNKISLKLSIVLGHFIKSKLQMN